MWVPSIWGTKWAKMNALKNKCIRTWVCKMLCKSRIIHFTLAHQAFGWCSLSVASSLFWSSANRGHASTEFLTSSGAEHSVMHFLSLSDCVQPCGINAQHITAALSLHLILSGEFLWCLPHHSAQMRFVTVLPSSNTTSRIYQLPIRLRGLSYWPS